VKTFLKEGVILMSFSMDKLYLKNIFLLLCCLLVVQFFPAVGMAGAPGMEKMTDDIVSETKSGKMWQLKKSKRIKTSEEVEAYLQDLNDGEYSDWRLPSKTELFALMSIFDLKQNGEVKIDVEGKYWLRDIAGNFHVGIWETGDQCGPSRAYYEAKAGYVRAIRP
jgi:hypothetical protein